MDTQQSSYDTGWRSLFGTDPGVGAERAQVKHSSSEQRPFGGNLAALAKDLFRMVDLQMQLLMLDLRQFWAGAKFAIILAFVAGLGFLAALPVFLLGLAGTLERMAGMNAATAQLAVAGCVFLLGVAAVRISVIWLSEASKTLKRSQEEFLTNLQWMREALHQEE